MLTRYNISRHDAMINRDYYTIETFYIALFRIALCLMGLSDISLNIATYLPPFRKVTLLQFWQDTFPAGDSPLPSQLSPVDSEPEPASTLRRLFPEGLPQPLVEVERRATETVSVEIQLGWWRLGQHNSLLVAVSSLNPQQTNLPQYSKVSEPA